MFVGRPVEVPDRSKRSRHARVSERGGGDACCSCRRGAPRSECPSGRLRRYRLDVLRVLVTFFLLLVKLRI